MKAKPILCPERLRRVPRQFGWVDQRLVRERHISRVPPNALALYLLLCLAADAEGLSYYSDATAGRLLSLSSGQVSQAREDLIRASLIAYRAPFYQVLSLEPASMALPPGPAASARSGGLSSIGDVLRQMMGEGPKSS
jgi:hypothetical protein